MADISVFAAEDFDPKAWVNSICAQQKAGAEASSIDRYLAEMEMRLQLAAEEIENGLQESSSQAMRRIPFAVQEIYRLQGDIQGMQDEVRVLAARVASDAGESAGCVVHLRQVDSVKRNMEAACATLKEATELSGMFIKVEDVFASGELPRVAAMLRSMRASLALVGDVPEFREGRTKLRQLEDRLQAQVEGALAAALTSKQPDAPDAAPAAEEHTRSLCNLLLAVDRYPTIASLYVDARLAVVHALWEEVSAPQGPGSASVGQWLPVFYARLLPLLKSEIGWVSRVLPEQRSQLVEALLAAVFDKISRAAIQRLSDPSVAMTTLMPLATDICHTAGAVVELLPSDLSAATKTDLLVRLLQPLEDTVRRYPDLELQALQRELKASLPASTPTATPAAGKQDGDQLVQQQWAAVRHMAGVCCAAVERCIALTGGSELASLATVIDKVLVQLISHVSRTTSQAVSQAGAAAASQALQAQQQGSHSVEEANEEVGTALRLVVLASEVAGGSLLRKVDAAVRAAINTTLPKMEAAAQAYSAPLQQAAPHGAGGLPAHPTTPHHPTASAAPGSKQPAQHTVAADPLALRLGRKPEQLQKVQAVARQLADPRGTPLPQATSQADALVRSTQAGALEALLARVHAALQPLPTLPQWRKRSGAGAAGLPSFSVEPLQYVTQLGDYLMYLPQQLEVLLSDELLSSSMTQDEQDELAAQWLDLVVAGAAAAYADTISRITELSQQGGVQLAADVEYFCNVMSALHVAPPPSLLTVQLFAGMPDAELPAAAKTALAEGGADAAALRALASQRQLQGQL